MFTAQPRTAGRSIRGSMATSRPAMALRVPTAPLTPSSPRQVYLVVSKTQQVTAPYPHPSEFQHATLHSGLEVSQLPALYLKLVSFFDSIEFILSSYVVHSAGHYLCYFPVFVGNVTTNTFRLLWHENHAETDTAGH